MAEHVHADGIVYKVIFLISIFIDKKTDSSQRTKIAQFYDPVVAVKGAQDNKRVYRRVHVSV